MIELHPLLLAGLGASLLLAPVCVYALWLYLSLGRLRRTLEQTRAGLEELLERRQLGLLDLLECCQRYMPHERTVLERTRVACEALAGARQRNDPEAWAEAESWLAVDLAQLLGQARNYAQLQADQAFAACQHDVLAVQRGIVEAREQCDLLVSRYNRRVARFPASILAGVFGFRAELPGGDSR